MNFQRPPNPLASLQNDAAAKIQSSVKTLLESKHLYQSISIDVKELCRTALALTPVSQQSVGLTELLQQVETWLWQLDGSETMLERLSKPITPVQQQFFIWAAPDIKVFCGRCQRAEPLNCIGRHTLIPNSQLASAKVLDPKGVVQVFALQYLCQSCKLVPETFLLSRLGNRLKLCGRSPMESVQAAAAIPKPFSRYVSDAQIAYQSGQTLAALFLLRTFCEQWCRPYALSSEKADEALDKYTASLPTDFKARFPSLRGIYSDLSVAIHSASEDIALFEKSKLQIEEHFEARKLFKLSVPDKTGTH
jgi:hypothetical protein